MSILVDSSVLIAFFRNAKKADNLDYLIAEDLLVVNEIILTELIPSLKLHRRLKHIRLIHMMRCLGLSINWDEITQMQLTCLRQGVNGVGIPDLIIAQHAIQNDLELHSLDKHFNLIAKYLPLQLYQF